MFDRIKTFLKEVKGNVALSATLMMVPIMGSVGAAIDYTRYRDMKSYD